MTKNPAPQDESEGELVLLLERVKTQLEQLHRSNSTMSKAILWDTRVELRQLYELAEEVLAEEAERRDERPPVSR